MQNNSNLNNFEVEEFIPVKKTVLERIQDGTYELSISRLKNLRVDDTTAFLGEGKETDSTIMGHIFEHYVKGLPLPDDYIISDGSTSETIQAILERVCYYSNKESLEDCKEELVEAARFYEWNKNYGEDALFKNLKGYQESYNIIREGKKIIKSSVAGLAKKMSESLVANPEFSYYTLRTEDINFKDEVTIRGEIQGIKCLGILDRIIEDDAEETITIVDFKCTSKPAIQAFSEYRWDLQGVFYKELLEQNLRKSQIGYNINVIFIVGRTNSPENPIILEMDSWDLRVAMEGIISSSVVRSSNAPEVDIEKKVVKGLKDYIDLYKRHLSTNFKTTAYGTRIRGVRNS